MQKIQRVWLKLRSLSVKQLPYGDSKFSADEKTSATNDVEKVQQCYENYLGISFFFKTGARVRVLARECSHEVVCALIHSDFGVNCYPQSDDGDEFLRGRCGRLSVSDAEYDCGCDFSRYSCLCSYSNQFTHLYLDRTFTFKFLNETG